MIRTQTHTHNVDLTFEGSFATEVMLSMTVNQRITSLDCCIWLKALTGFDKFPKNIPLVCSLLLTLLASVIYSFSLWPLSLTSPMLCLLCNELSSLKPRV